MTLGGSYRYLGRRFGLACDNVRSAEVVTATGEVLVASPDQHEDLYWGIRGGVGNFGVVTGFEFELHPFGPDILSVDLAYPIDAGGPPGLARAVGGRQDVQSLGEASRRPCSGGQLERSRRQLLAADLAQPGPPLCVEARHVAAGRANPKRERLPPLLEARMLNANR